MKADIHPNYVAIKANCSCGNVIETRSTLGKDILIEVCSECHPFYTGKQKFVDAAGRVEKFSKRYAGKIKPKASKAAKDSAEKPAAGDASAQGEAKSE